ncbi:MAG: hypothetical protein LBU67_05150 [Oscillospiraceae bacterium]|jgi:hypothetical protein|nr:hypothetical protein [Oscillospiraceae bacterium]
MERFYRIFLAVMALLAALGVALLVAGALAYQRRPLTPAEPYGTARLWRAQEVAHV